MNDFASFTNGVLHAACDRLKVESEDTISGFVAPRIDYKDAHGDLVVDCGGLRVSKRKPSWRFRSCRMTCAIRSSSSMIEDKNDDEKGEEDSASVEYERIRSSTPYYFEFVVSELMGSGKMSTSSSNNHRDRHAFGSVCVGFSTKQMPLNALVGALPDSMGINSSGYLLMSGKRWSIGGKSCFEESAVIGVLCHMDQHGVLKTAFYVDGRIVAKPKPMAFSPDTELYPTISLISPSVSVSCNLSVEDFLYPPNCSIQGL